MTLKLTKAFPNLKDERYEVTSPKSRLYNCIAWAAGRTDRVWWPNPMPGLRYYWPPTAPLIRNIDSFVKAFSSLGFEVCDNPELEPGFDKVAIYTNKNNEPEHMARQLSSGKWTSKLGPDVDIEHETLRGVEGFEYGKATCILKRPEKQGSSS